MEPLWFFGHGYFDRQDLQGYGSLLAPCVVWHLLVIEGCPILRMPDVVNIPAW